MLRMPPKVHSFLATLGGFGLLALAVFIFLQRLPLPEKVVTFTAQRQFSTSATSTSAIDSTSAIVKNVAAITTSADASTTPKAASVQKSTKAPNTVASQKSTTTSNQTENQIAKIENPYPFGSKTFSELNVEARSALVNIFCDTPGGTAIHPISASGVMIDPRGIIMTNAHVAQYVLLSARPELQISCVVRNGSPATPRFYVQVMYIPATWVREHAHEISEKRPIGTGENDYALLYVTDSVDGSPLSRQFPYLPVDAREGIGFTGDSVLVAGYPAEFIGSSATRSDLYASSAVTTIGDMLTFTQRLVDLISLGGVVLAQGGSSGGAVVNGWGQLIGIVVTTSEGTTTVTRDLRALTMSHVDRSLSQQTGTGLRTFLSGDPAILTMQFQSKQTPALSQLIIDQIATH